MPSCCPNGLQDPIGFHLVPGLQQLTRKLHLQLISEFKNMWSSKDVNEYNKHNDRLRVFKSNLIITIYAMCIGVFNWCKLGILHDHPF